MPAQSRLSSVVGAALLAAIAVYAFMASSGGRGALEPGPSPHTTATRTPSARLEPPALVRVHVLSARDGAPLGGANVQLSTREAEPVLVTAHTDAAGIAEAHVASAGDIELSVRAPGYAPLARHLTLPSGTQLEVQAFSLPDGTVARGTVRDPRGTPVSGATLTVTESSGAATVATRSDEHGRFELDALPAGSYRFSALAEPVGAGSTGWVELGGAAVDLEIVLDRGHVVHGRVLDGARRPAAGVRVRLWPSPDGDVQLPSGMRELVTDEHGRFEFVAVDAARVYVAASLGGWYSEIAEIDATRAHGVELSLHAGDMIRGRVVDDQGRAVPGARVEGRWLQASVSGADVAAWEAQTVTSDAAGAFELARVRPGQWQLQAYAPEAAIAARFARQLRPATVTAGAEHVELVSAGLGAIAGSVEVADGALPSGVVVIASGQHAACTPSGSFLLDGVPEGRHRVVVAGDDLAPFALPEIEVHTRATTALGRIVVERGRTLRGSVLDRAGRPLAGAKVSAGMGLHLRGYGARRGDLDNPELRIAYSDRDGSFELRGLRGGALVAEHPSGGRSAFVPVSAATDGLTLLVGVSGEVRGKLTRAGVPMAAQVVVAREATGAAMFRALSDRGGQYRLSALPPGAYTLTVASRGEQSYALERRDVQVTARETQHADFELATGTVRVVLHTARAAGADASASLRGAELYVHRGGGHTHTFSHVAPGRYSACISPRASAARGEARCRSIDVGRAPETQDFEL